MSPPRSVSRIEGCRLVDEPGPFFCGINTRSSPAVFMFLAGLHIPSALSFFLSRVDVRGFMYVIAGSCVDLSFGIILFLSLCEVCALNGCF